MKSIGCAQGVLPHGFLTRGLQAGRLKRHCVFLLLGILAPGWAAAVDVFSVVQQELKTSPFAIAQSWWAGAVTKDSRVFYGMGHSHNAYGQNSLWLYDPLSNSHARIFPDTSRYYRWLKDANGKPIAGSGYWAKLDPVADKVLYDFFGGPNIVALTNRHNHQLAYVPSRDEIWILAGTTQFQGNPYFGGRFDLNTRRWVNLSRTLSEFTASLIEGLSGWVGPNAGQAWCPDIDSGFFFAGGASTALWLIEPNLSGTVPYKATRLTSYPMYRPVHNLMNNVVCVGEWIYYLTAQEKYPGLTPIAPNPAPFWRMHLPTRHFEPLPNGPPGAYFPMVSHDSDQNAIVYYGGSKSNQLWVFDLDTETWHKLDRPDLPRQEMHAGGFVPGFGHVYKGGHRFDAAGNKEGYTGSMKVQRIRLQRN